MKKIAFLFFLVSFCHIKPNCQQVTYQEAIAVAKSELRYTKGLFVEITDVHTFDSNGHTLLYEVVIDLQKQINELNRQK
jgi:ABC-type transporter Mla MlaB component